MSLEDSQSSNQEAHTITTSDLPLSCPLPHMQLWDNHPRIYLPISKTGYTACPYCSAVYYLAKP